MTNAQTEISVHSRQTPRANTPQETFFPGNNPKLQGGFQLILASRQADDFESFTVIQRTHLAYDTAAHTETISHGKHRDSMSNSYNTAQAAKTRGNCDTRGHYRGKEREEMKTHFCLPPPPTHTHSFMRLSIRQNIPSSSHWGKK